MDYKSLKALKMIISHNSFERAASSLHLTQSAISQRIKQLEAQLGEPLLLRNQPYQATPLGETLLAHYQKVVMLEDDLYQTLNPDDSHVNVAIAINRDSLETWAQALFEPLAQRPITLDIFSDDQELTLTYLKKGLVNGALSTQEKALSGCHSHYLGDMTYLLVASDKLFTERPKRMTVSLLKKTPMLVFDGKDQVPSQYLKEYFDMDEHPNCHFVPSVSAYRHACLAGMGIALIPRLDIEKELDEGTLFEVSKHRWHMPLYWHHFIFQSEHHQEINRLIIELARSQLLESEK